MADIRRIREDALKEWDKKKEQDEQARYKANVPDVERILKTVYVDQIKTDGDVSDLWLDKDIAHSGFRNAFVKYCEKQGFEASFTMVDDRVKFIIYEKQASSPCNGTTQSP